MALMATRFHETTLPSGLRIAAEVMPAAASAAVGMFVRTGTRDEPRELMGVSHFLEHMMFKGSATRRGDAVNEAFDRIGARNNAFTSHEMTAYHAHTIPEHALEALGLVADLLRPALRQEDFDQERGVILEEIAMYEDNPLWTVYERVQEAYFGGHPLGYRVLGTPDSIQALQRDSMKRYFEERYAPSNTVVVAAGNIDFDALVRRAQEETDQWKSRGVPRVYPPLASNTAKLTFQDKRATRAYMMFAWPGPDHSDPRRYAAALCAYVLGGQDGSRLYWSLIESGIAVHASTEHQGHDRSGQVIGSVVCSSDDVEQAGDIFTRECGNLRDSLTEGDLSRARSMLATAVALAGESPSGRMQRIGMRMSTVGGYKSLEDELRTIQALSLTDLRDCLDDFPPVPLVSGCVVPPS
ncbi:MAG: insulinase family protein [Planctomycetes bacterium]|nr:insulinase family protein [Planctomycetota bacterium]